MIKSLLRLWQGIFCRRALTLKKGCHFDPTTAGEKSPGQKAVFKKPAAVGDNPT